MGLSLTPVQAAASTLLQAYIPNDKRGRAGAAMNTVITLASMVSMGLSGMLGDALGVRQVFNLSGLIIVFAGLLASILTRSSAPADAGPGFAVKEDAEVISTP